MSIVESIFQRAAAHLNEKFLFDDVATGGLTWKQIIEYSGRIYAFLKEKGIGREDFVLICLPRGVKPIIAEIGVWRAGAAFALVEDTYAPERIAYIEKDCSCKQVINVETWEEIMQMNAIEGYEQPQPHDAAFAIYTSGTTGNPKGVLHEYGNLERIQQSLILQNNGHPLINPNEHFALVAPLNFVASVMVEIYCLTIDGVLYVTPYATVKNPMALALYLIKNNITATFLTPSHLRKMDKKPPMLRMCVIGSEPANNVFVEGLEIHNFYAMSESGFAVAHFVIDKRYEVTPVGKSEFGHPIYLLDETTGEPVPDGEEGEICFPNEFVRGYMNLPEETAKAFRDGMYHTGDLGRFDENGNLLISGRLGDMVKVNGNRVEPGEIENVFRRITDAKQVACRIFDDKRGVHICMYYTDDLKIDEEKTRNAMQRFLPYYMIPSFFIHLDAIPLRPNGKMDRKALPAPDFSSYQDSYVAPRDEIETKLCDAFAKALDVERIGIHDDFYQLGGDSLASMQVITLSGLDGLTATDIFRGHTPEKIAVLYKESVSRNDGMSVAQIVENSIKREHPLTEQQRYMVDYQLYTPNSTMYNLFKMIKVDKNVIDMERMTQALNTAVQNHPALLTTLHFNSDGEIIQKYTPEIWQDVELEKVTESELHEKIIPTLVKPFRIIGRCLFRARIFETEEAGYLFMDVHHTVFDGTSSKVFFNSLLTAYAGQKPAQDGYYYMLNTREKAINSPFYQESHDYFHNRYDNVKWTKRPAPDIDTRENEYGEMMHDLPITSERLDEIRDCSALSPNAFFLTVGILAMAVYEGKHDIQFAWIYNGRNNAEDMSSVGLLFKALIVGVKLNKELTLDALYADVVEQIDSGIEHSCYEYLAHNSAAVTDDLACMLYQDDLRNVDGIPGLLGEVEVPYNQAASQSLLDIQILNTPDGMKLAMDYAASRYKPGSIERFRKLFGVTVSILAEQQDAKVPLKLIVRSIMKQAGEDGLLNPERWLLWL